jgi:hypothetical protein
MVGSSRKKPSRAAAEQDARSARANWMKQSTARRDQSEFGFVQMRLVVCFPHWANLKEKRVEQYDSPLVLLPVQLRKKKGIRDTYYLDVVSSDAEINPVVRRQFMQFYDIALPESIDWKSNTTVGSGRMRRKSTTA